MTTYYVRKNGSDAYSTAQAQNPATPWLTIDKAANNVAAGDTVYVGAGTYREQVTMDTSGSSGSPIKFIADIDGSHTGDAGGLVVISAFTDSNTVSRASCWDPDGRTFVEVYDFVMQGGTAAVVYSANATDDNYEGVVFDGCVFLAGPDNFDYAVQIDMNQATTPTNNGLTFRNCLVSGPGLRLQWDGNATADQNLKVSIDNCLFVGSGGAGFAAAVCWEVVSTAAYGSGGVSINNCTVLGYVDGVFVEDSASVTYPVDVRNCYFNCNVYALEKASSNDGALTSDYNTFSGALSYVTAGANDREETSTWLFGGIADLPLYRKLGWSPYKPWEPMRNQSDDDWTSLIGDASATYAPATDMYGNPRPMHGTADDRGAVEGRARPEQETSTVYEGSNAIRFEGAGYVDIPVLVNAESTTVTVRARYDSNYSGSLPKLETKRIPGVSTQQSDVMTALANTWEQLSVTFTPTEQGIAVIRLSSQDTSATGKAFFDDLPEPT